MDGIRAKQAERASQSSVLVVPGDDRAVVRVSGKDRLSWLNGLVTCELAKLGPGDAAYGLLVEKKGRIRTDLVVVPGDDGSLALSVPAARRDETLSVLDHHLIMEDVELAPADLATFAAYGPKAEELVANATLAPYRGRLDLLGRGGAVLVAEASLRPALEAEVERLGGFVADDADWEPVRIEAGLPRFGVEVDDTLYPQEASLEKLAVSFSKGCYLGQEVVYMLENRGHVKRKLVPLDLADGDVPPLGAQVTTPDGAVVGDVKSAALGPRKGRPVAIAMIKWASSKPGTELRVDGNAAIVR